MYSESECLTYFYKAENEGEKYHAECFVIYWCSVIAFIIYLIPILIMIPVVFFAVVSGLWVSVSVCYDAALLMIFFFALWAVVPTAFTNDLVAGIALVGFLIIYTIIKLLVSKKATNDYETLSVFHLLFAKKRKSSVFLSVVFFIFSFLGAWVFLDLLLFVLFPDFMADAMRGLPGYD